jgi:16S rRNA processing protein RimM
VLLEQHGTRRTCRIVSAAPHGAGLLLVGFDGVSDRTAAEGLTGARILVPTADLPPPSDDEFYWHEVLGFAVVTVDGRALGELVETFSTGLNDVWVVRGSGGEHLIPVIADVVRAIDRAARRIVIEPIPGLLD